MTYAQAIARVQRIHGSDGQGTPDNRYAGVTARVKMVGARGSEDWLVEFQDRRPNGLAGSENGKPTESTSTALIDAAFPA